jgi:hypothetical protein
MLGVGCGDSVGVGGVSDGDSDGVGTLVARLMTLGVGIGEFSLPQAELEAKTTIARPSPTNQAKDVAFGAINEDKARYLKE